MVYGILQMSQNLVHKWDLQNVGVFQWEVLQKGVLYKDALITAIYTYVWAVSL
jgi:hypothetical protein